jgi:hypothetical protein
MPIYSAADIIGKTLIAKKSIGIKREPTDLASIIFTVQPGQSVGIVDSYYNVIPGRSVLYWGFKDANGRNYYAPHLEGYFDLTALKDQGVITTQEKTQLELQKNETTKSFIERNIKNIIIIAAAAYILKEPIKNLLKK